jgi:cyclophilin family peptidyl-prolyl cis-trans isomerase
MLKMNKLIMLALALPFMYCTSGCTAPRYEVVQITTDYGKIHLWLYDETPGHKQNFLKLAKEKFYDQTQFHRVITEFMIQGGDPNTKDESKENEYGNGGPGYTLPAEISQNYFHKKGALAAARLSDDVNPNRESSGSQFYIVQGRVFDESMLQRMEQHISSMLQSDYKFPEETRKVYQTIGGAPHLDMQYTVFGEVISGLDVVDKIAALPRGPNDRPMSPVKMTVDILTLTAKELKKDFGFDVPVNTKQPKK